VNRLFGCTGSAQLIASVLAGLSNDRNAAGDSSRKNYLIYYDLGLEQRDAIVAASVLKNMANRVYSWENIVYLDENFVAEFYREFWSRGFDYSLRKLLNKLDVSGFDELYLGQNRFFLNRFLLNAFKSAKKVCVGDAIGINYSCNYLDGAWTPPGKIAARTMLDDVRECWRSVKRKALATNLIDVPFDEFCMLAPNLFDEHIDNPVTPDANEAIRLFREASDIDEQPIAVNIRTAIAECRQILVILSADWSGRGHLSEEDEVSAMMDFVSGLGQSRHAVVLLKPHPRESQRKIALFSKSLTKAFDQLFVLDERRLAYQPFEAFYQHCLMPVLPGKTITVAGFSSAVLGMELLFGQRCQLGFGVDIVSRYFLPERKERRLVQERDLQKAIQSIRSKSALLGGSP
jgi:hypothetical protein